MQAAPSRRVLKATRLAMPGGPGWHSHRELQWIAAGRGVILIETEEAQWLATPGQALIIASNVPHDLKWYGAPGVMTIYLDPRDLIVPNGANCCCVAVSPLMKAAVEELSHPAHGAGRDERGEFLSRIIFEEIALRSQANLTLPNPVSREIRTLCRQLRDKPSRYVSLDVCAQSVGASRRTFTRRFRQETGDSFAKWMRKLRAVHALKLRAEGENAKRICDACGYDNVRYMHFELRKLLGAPMSKIIRGGRIEALDA